MGRLTPGATYVYERDGDNVYAREMGSPFRTLIGSTNQNKPTILGFPAEKVARWVDILREAEHTPALQEALDRAIIIYELSRKDQTVDHHPV